MMRVSKEVLIIFNLIYKSRVIIRDIKFSLILISIYFNNKVEINVIS